MVDEADLLAALEAAGGELPACSCTEKCAPGAINTAVSYTHLCGAGSKKLRRERSVIIQQYSIIYADPPWRYSAKKVPVSYTHL